MKIAFCTPGSGHLEDYKNQNLLGIESQVWGLAREFVNKNHEVYIFRRWYSGLNDEKVEGINIININSFDFHDDFLQKSLSKLFFSLRLKNKINVINPDVIILTELLSSFFINKLEIPKVYVTHNPPTIKKKNSLKYLIKKWMESRLYKNCDCIISLNTSIKKYLESEGYETIYIPNAITPDYYLDVKDEGYILCAGRFVDLKGFKYLIHAYSMIKNDLKINYNLFLVGYGPEKENLENLVEELKLINYVKFIPWLSKTNFIDIVSRCSLFVLPSLSETFGIVLLEAMACKKKVIASDLPSSRDIITSGHDGFLFEKKNITQLKEYIVYCLLNSKTNLMGENARKTIENRFVFNKIADEYISLFNKLIGK